jgi:sterol desaturase/sphingolipid hydroxylase (fatty acid hydroxylase superfamily)
MTTTSIPGTESFLALFSWPLTDFALFSDDQVSVWMRGLSTGVLAVAATVVLELTCLQPHVHQLLRSNRALYISALWCNVLNNVGLGSVAYYLAVRYLCQPPAPTQSSSLYDQVSAIVMITIIEAVLYYAVHKAFHEVKGLYWMHSYHHKFNTIVVPSSAHAVSMAEYTLAYMMPLLVGVAGSHANERSFFIATALIAVSNLLIHTPWLQDYSVPWIFVSAFDHGTHHRKLRGDYGAPIFHVDRILEYFLGGTGSARREKSS